MKPSSDLYPSPAPYYLVSGFQPVPVAFQLVPVVTPALYVNDLEDAFHKNSQSPLCPRVVLWESLLQNEIFDSYGKLIKTLEPIKALSKQGTQSLYDFLHRPHSFKLKNYNFECSLSDLLNFFLNRCGDYIENIYLIEEGANFFWEKESILNLLVIAGIEDPNPLPIDELIESFHGSSNNFTIRIELKESASSFNEGDIEQHGLNGLSVKIQRILEQFIYDRITSISKPILQKFNPTYEYINPNRLEENQVSYRLMGELLINLDFVHNLQVPFETEQDYAIDLSDLLCCPSQKELPLAPVVFPSSEGYGELFAQLLGHIKPLEPSKGNITRLLKHIAKQVKGGVVFNVWSEKSFIDRYIGLLKKTEFSQSHSARSSSNISEENIALVIWSQLTDCMERYIGSNRMSVFCFTFTFCRMLEGKINQKILFLVWEKCVHYMLHTKEYDDFQDMVIECCSKEIGENKWNFKQASQFLLIIFFVMDRERSLPPSIQIFNKQNGGQQCMQINYRGEEGKSSLLIDFDPVQALKDIAKPLQLAAKDHFIPLIISKGAVNHSSPVFQNIIIDVEQIKINLTMFLSSSSLYILGYRLWMSIELSPQLEPFSQIKIQPSIDPHFPLMFLAKSNFSHPARLLKSLCDLALLKEHQEFFYFLAEIDHTFPNRLWLVKCIQAMLSNKCIKMQSLGMGYLNELLGDKNFLATHPQEAACLFWFCPTFNCALEVFLASKLKFEEQGEFLFHLIKLGYNEYDPYLIRDQLLDMIENWFTSHVPESNETNALLLLRYAKSTFKTDSQKCFSLWLNHQNNCMWEFLLDQHVEEYHNFLLSLLPLVDVQSQDQIASALEKMSLNASNQERFDSLKSLIKRNSEMILTSLALPKTIPAISVPSNANELTPTPSNKLVKGSNSLSFNKDEFPPLPAPNKTAKDLSPIKTTRPITVITKPLKHSKTKKKVISPKNVQRLFPDSPATPPEQVPKQASSVSVRSINQEQTRIELEREFREKIYEIKKNLTNFNGARKSIKNLVCNGVLPVVLSDMQELFKEVINRYTPLSAIEFVIDNKRYLANPNELILLAAEHLPGTIEKFLDRGNSVNAPLKALAGLLNYLAVHAQDFYPGLSSSTEDNSEKLLLQKLFAICYEGLKLASGKYCEAKSRGESISFSTEIKPKVWDYCFEVVSGMVIIDWDLLLHIYKIDYKLQMHSIEKLADEAQSLLRDDRNLERIHAFCKESLDNQRYSQAELAIFLHHFFHHLFDEKKGDLIELWKSELKKNTDEEIKIKFFDFCVENKNYEQALEVAESFENTEKYTKELFGVLCIRRDEQAIRLLLGKYAYFVLLTDSSSAIGNVAICLSQASRFEESLRLLHRYEIDNFTYWKAVIESVWKVGTPLDWDLAERFYQSQLDRTSFLLNVSETSEWVKMIQQMKGSSKITWFHNNTPEGLFQKSIKNGDFSLFETILPNVSVNKALPNGEPPLHQAIKSGRTEMILPLMEAGAEPIYNWEKFTPFDLAVQSNQKEILLVLLSCFVIDQQRSDVEAQILSKIAPRIITQLTSRIVNLSVLAQNASRYGKEIYSGTLNFANVAENLNKLDEAGQAPLHYAIQGCQENILNELFERGANPRKKTRDGISALHLAAINGSPSIILQLIQRGLDINERDAEQFTPLHYAAVKGRIEIFSLLVKAGGDPFAKASQGLSPIALIGCTSYLKDPLLLPTRQSFFFTTMLAYGVFNTFYNLSDFDKTLISVSSSLVLNHEVLIHACKDLFFGNKKRVYTTALIGITILTYFPIEKLMYVAFDRSVMTVIYGALTVLNTYRIGMDCFKGLKNCWKNVGFRNYKVAFNAIVHVGTAAFLGNQLWTCVEFFRKATNPFNKDPAYTYVENKSSAKPTITASSIQKQKKQIGMESTLEEILELIKKGPVVLQSNDQQSTVIHTYQQYVELIQEAQNWCINNELATKGGLAQKVIDKCNTEALENLGKWPNFPNFLHPREDLKVVFVTKKNKSFLM